MKSSLSTPSLKKAPLATEDHLDDLEGAASEAKDSEVKDSEAGVKIVHLRPHQRSHNQRRCQSEVTPSKTAELLVSSKQKLFRYLWKIYIHSVAKVYEVLPFYDVKCLCSGGRE